MGKLPEFNGEPEILINTDPSAKLIEAVPEEDDGKIAIMRFTFEIENIPGSSGAFKSIHFNPRGWFDLKHARLDGLDEIWLNNTENADPSLSATEHRPKLEHHWVSRNVPTPYDDRRAPQLFDRNKLQVKNGDTFTVRYKLTRQNEVEPNPYLAPNLENTYWVNTNKRITRYDFSADLKDAKVGRQFNADLQYGDIAISKDGKYIYAIEFVGGGGNFNRFRIDKYDARTGELVGRSQFNLGDGAAGNFLTDGGQLNALTFDYDGMLLFSTPKRNRIWKLNPECVKPLDEKNATCTVGGGSDIELTDFKWPERIYSAGDFFVGADGSLYGAGTYSSGHATGKSTIVRWSANTPGDPQKGRSNVAENVGMLPLPTYGMGRFRNYILSVQTTGTSHTALPGGSRRSGLVWSRLVENRDGLYDIASAPFQAPTVRNTLFGDEELRDLWGATSIQDSRPYNEMILRIEKEVIGGRANPDDQFELGAFSTSGVATSGRTYLSPPVKASSPATGVQDQVSFNYVKPGEKYTVFETFLDGNGSAAPGRGEGYKTTLKCVEGSTWDPNGIEVPTGQLSEIDENAERTADITIPNRPNLEAVTCRFANSTAPDKASLALFKVSDVDGRQNVKRLDGAEFSLYEADAESADGSGDKIADITPNPETGYSADGLEFGRDYILVETKAPAGYALLTQPIRFRLELGENGNVELKLLEQPSESGVVLAADDLNAQQVVEPGDAYGVSMTVMNVEQPELPKTGGPGVYSLVVMGALIVILGGSAAHPSRRRFTRV